MAAEPKKLSEQAESPKIQTEAKDKLLKSNTKNTTQDNLITTVIQSVLIVLFFSLFYLIYNQNTHLTNTLSESKHQTHKKHTHAVDPDAPHTNDVQMYFSIDLEDVYTGKTIQLSYERHQYCEECSGTGGDAHICTSCRGHGMKIVERSMGSFRMRVQEPCSECEGAGEIFSRVCPICHGNKVVQRTNQIDLPIDPGVPEDHIYTFREHADQVPGYIPGDVYVRVTTKEHSRFLRKGDDLYCEQYISLLEALTGVEIQIEHLDGHIVTHKKLTVTAPESVIEIPNEGMPIFRGNGKKGKLFIQISVIFPTSLTEQQKRDVQQLLS